MAKKIQLGILLILVVLTSSIYFLVPDQVRIDIEDTRNRYSVYEDGSWVLAATEYVNIFDGTTKMRAKERNTEYDIDDVFTTVTKTALFKDNITLIETITFENNVSDIRLVPIYHSVRVLNADDKILHFEYRDILYEGETKDISSPFSFGHRMKLEWDDGAYLSKVYQQSVASDKIVVRYRVAGDDFETNVRLFDPPTNTIDYINEYTKRTCTDDGCTLEIFQSNVAYKDSEGIFHPINISIESYNQDGYSYSMTQADYNVFFKSNSNWGDGVKYCVDDQCLIYQPSDYSYRDRGGSQDYIQSVGNVPANVDGSNWSYENIYNNVDLIFELDDNSMKEKYVINELPKTPATWLTEPVTLDFGGYIKYGDLRVWVDGVDVTSQDFITSSKIEFRNSTGATLFYLPAPYAYDNNGDTTYNVSYEVKNQNNDIWFYLRTPYEWIQNAAYPVTIDPTSVVSDRGDIISISSLGAVDTVMLKNKAIVSGLQEQKGLLNLETLDKDTTYFKLQYTNITNNTNYIQDNKYVINSTTKDIRIYDKPEGIEYELLLKEKPDSNVFSFDLNTSGLDFFYQAPLYLEEGLSEPNATCNATNCKNIYRPENVVESYAVYYADNKNNNEYKTGKAYHIYKPWVEDSTGERVWAELHIDEKKELLSITVDSTWLETATYPVVIDPTIGYTTIGSSSATIAYNDFGDVGTYRTGNNNSFSGTGSNAVMYAALKVNNGFTTDVYAFLNSEDSGGANIHDEVLKGNDSIAITTTATFYSINMATDSFSTDDYIINLFASASGIGFTNNVYLSFDSVTSISTWRDYKSGTTLNTADPWSESESAENWKYSLYINYTAASTNSAPDKPSLNNPTNGSTGQELSVDLNVSVTDSDGDTMNVSFYKDSDDSQIGSTQTSISNGSTAQVTWSGLSTNTNYDWYANVTDGTATTKSDAWTFTTGAPDTNFSIWTGSAWTDADYDVSSEIIQFSCGLTETNCEPRNQDTSSSQSIYQVCNNGTASGTGVYMHLNETFTNIDMKCDDDYTASGATVLTTSNQTIHGTLTTSSCVNISCWADYSNPTSGGIFDVYAYVYS